MKLKITQKGLKMFNAYRLESGARTECDFVHRYHEKHSSGNLVTTVYKCNSSEEMEVNDRHYSKSMDLKEFVKKGLLEEV